MSDARKEFDATVKIGYGVDGESTVRDADFDAVRGTFEDNAFVKQLGKTTAKKILAADTLIEKLRKVQQ